MSASHILQSLATEPNGPVSAAPAVSATPSVSQAGSIAPASTLLRGWIRRFWREIAVVGLFSFVANLLMLTPTVYMLQVYDRVLSSKSLLTLLVVSVIAVFMLMMVAFVEWSRTRVLVRLGILWNEVMAERVFRAMFIAAEPGKPSGRPLADMNELRQFLTGPAMLVLFDTPWTPIYIGVLFLLHPILGLVAIGFTLLQAVVAIYAHRHGLAPQLAVVQAQTATVAFLQAKVRNAEVVSVLGMVKNLGRRWMGYHQSAMHLAEQAHDSQHRVMAFSKWLRYSAQSLSLGVGALLVIDGQLSAGAMIAANVLMTRALAPVDQLSGSWRGFISARAAYDRLAALLAGHGQPAAVTSNVDVDMPTGEVRLAGVSVTAPRSSQLIVQDVSFTLPVGKVTLLTGPSGSGKSTLARALLGVWPVSTGVVSWGERKLTDWSAEGRGPCVGYLPQDVELFAGTIAENICRLTQVNSDLVVEAARTADLHEALLRLPKGYDTPIGEAGQLLSAGQRQRLGLARAVYGKPLLVVLDEPNANLDESGEAALLRCVQRLKREGVAVLIISHRPGVRAVADQIVMLVGGRIESIIDVPLTQPGTVPTAMGHPVRPSTTTA